MLTDKRYHRLVCLQLGILWLIVGCVSGTQVSPTPIATVDASVTASLTAIPQPTNTPTPTPIATLLPEAGRARVLELLADNGGCRLPCWWGITPGQTSWEDARTFFLQFDPFISERTTQPNAEVHIPGERGFYGNLTQIGVFINTQGNQIVSMEVYGLEDGPYSVPEFLGMYGRPEEVWIKTYSQYAGEEIPFVILLFYPESGFAAAYSDYVEKSPILQACLEWKPQVLLWDPQERITLREFGVMFEWDITDFEPFLPLEEATGMDIDTFYQLYKDAPGLVCVETPRDLWPNPFAP